MIFNETPLPGAFVIELEKLEDERGYFARAWCAREAAEQGLDTRVAQQNLSYNRKAGTLRGMHYQVHPYEEVKLVRCLAGRLLDVIVDLREGSPARGQSFAVELSAENGRALYVPAGFAHGFQTLEDHTQVFYQMSEFYTPDAQRGFRYDDPMLDVDWPLPVSAIAPRDASWPDYDD